MKYLLSVLILLYFNLSDVLFPNIIANIKSGIEFQSVSSYGDWEISFPTGFLEDGTPVKGKSILTYDGMKNYTPAVLLNFRFLNYADINISFAPWFLGLNSKGTGTDDDLLTATGYRPTLFSRSRFDTYNEDSFFDITANFMLTRRPFKKRYLIVNAITGYMKNVENINMKNGEQLVSDNNILPLPPVGTKFNDLDSKYKFDWDSLKFGVNTIFSITSYLDITSSLSILYNFYSGEGYWNLRTYSSSGNSIGAFRNEEPSFIHYDTTGIGFKFDFGLNLKIVNANVITIYYCYDYMTATDGQEKIYFYDSSNNYIGEDVKVDIAKFTKSILAIGFRLKIDLANN